MNEIKCAIKGCKEVHVTTDTIVAAARFICKNHPRTVQLRAVGRNLKKSDNSDAGVKFQEGQFDPNIRR